VKNNYLYNKKELQTGLGLYDYGARFYDPVIGRWTSMDPLAEKFLNSSPYLYALNNPVLLVDRDGRAPGPGDLFTTIDDAAKDFGKTYNGISITLNREIAATFYSKEVDGKTVYSYSTPLVGQRTKSSPSALPKGTKRVAIGHLHSAYALKSDNYFSGTPQAPMPKGEQSDIILGFMYQVEVIYLGSPNGQMQKHFVQTNVTQVISSDLPSDPNDPARVNHIPPSGELPVGIDNPPLDFPYGETPPPEYRPHRPRPVIPGIPGAIPSRLPFFPPPNESPGSKKREQVIQ
jgi:RHS repeat-associated protein